MGILGSTDEISCILSPRVSQADDTRLVTLEENLQPAQLTVKLFALYFAYYLTPRVTQLVDKPLLVHSKSLAKKSQMKREDVLKQLREARKSIDRAIKWIDHSTVYENSEAYAVGECLECKQPINSDQGTTRGVHRECYNALNNQFIRTKLKSWDDLQAEGRVGPRGKPGRKGRGESTG